MARPGVTYTDVSNVAQQLVAAGKPPTIESIRIALGTGSNSTLGTHLRVWKSKRDQTQQIATIENIPVELISALKGVWERVMNQTDDRIQSIHQETQHELSQLTQEVQRLQKDNSHWQQQHQQAKQERDSLVHEKSTIEHLLANAKIEVATLLEKHVGAEQQCQEKQLRIDELHRQNQQIQANLEHYRNASLEQRLADQQRYEQQQRQFEKTVQEINYELAELKRENIILQQNIQHTNFENGSLNTQLHKIEDLHECMTKRLTETLNDLSKQTQAHQHWHEQYQLQQAKCDEQMKSFIELKTQYAILVQLSESIKHELNQARDQNKLLAHEKWLLGQEKAQLFGQVKQLESSL